MGIDLIITWFAATFNWAWELNFSWPEIRGGAAIYSSILLLVLVFGMVRVRFFEPGAGTVRVHGIIADEQTSEVLYGKFIPLLKTDREAYRREVVRNYDTYIEATIRESRAGAKIVVWPENAVVGTREDLDALITRIGQVAKSENIYLAMGMVVLDSDIGEMRLAAFDPSGKMVIDHLKYAYDMKRDLGKVDLQTMDTPYGRLAAVLCGDLDNPGVISQLGRKGVDILLVPAMEDADSAPWHHRLAAFRSVENGFSMVRVTMAGSSLVSDPYGRILAAMNYFNTTDRVMVAQVPTHGVHTIFDTIGNLFGWLNIAGFVVLAGWAIIRGRKTRVEAAGSTEAQAPSV